jgi:hypothetical protein
MDFVWIITINDVPTTDGYFIDSEKELAENIAARYSNQNQVSVKKLYRYGQDDDPCPCGQTNCC